jgi:urease beta subunit
MERKKPKKPHVKGKGEREIQIGSEIWFWKVGKTVVSILSPNGKRTNVNKCSDVFDYKEPGPEDDLDYLSGPSITPTAVYNYIVHNRSTIS